MQDDQSIKGTARVNVPMTVMKFFGKNDIPLTVECTAQLDVPNTDIMLTLDVTGSMNESNPGDSLSRMAVMKSVVKQFFATMEASKQTGSRIRYGFVPYSTNVNVGGLLKDEWMVTSWTYPSRVLVGNGAVSGTFTYTGAYSIVSGNIVKSTSTYPATYNAWTRTYSCTNVPANTYTETRTLISTTSTTLTTPVAGTRTTKTYNYTQNGAQYSVTRSGTTCALAKTQYNAFVQAYDEITEPRISSTSSQWLYRDVTNNVSGWRTGSNGCVEERRTYEIDDYDNVDLTRALDLDIDTVPTATNPDTQWRPQYPGIIYDRAITWSYGGSFSTATVSTNTEYLQPGIAGFAACPAPARKLQTWNAVDFATYVDGLRAGGSTYHDIGMIWAGRLLSPTGLFASENRDVAAKRPTSRHMIFLTDGQTSSLDISYGAYGVEPLAQRRWTPTSTRTLTQTVEARFAYACEAVKKKNITVWLVAFGTELNPIMTGCAGEGHYWAAADADELTAAFETIAKSIGDLRLAD